MRHWIEAARLRTLPLSVSGIIVGSVYALANPTRDVLTPTQNFGDGRIFGFAILTTLGLQILSNFANDYGDGIRGTDNDDRIGPRRTIQSGAISAAAMKRAMVLTAALTLLSACLLIYFAFHDTNPVYSVFFFILGLLAIASAIRYTVGNTAYGYHGYGDMFVFVFFGLVSTLGVNFLHSKQVDWQLVLPAAAIGLLSAGVLNLNNMRDEASDRKAGKNTLVVKMGGEAARRYHYFLVVTAMVLVLVFALIYNGTGFIFDQYIFLVAYFPIVGHLIRVSKIRDPRQFDPELRRLAIATFLLSVLLSLALIFLLSDVIVNNS